MKKIIGTRRWNDPKVYYSQENNPAEHMLGELETCGPTAAVNCLAAMDILPRWKTPGGYEPQPEQELTDFLNDPTQYLLLRSGWQGLNPSLVLGNEVAQWYPMAVHCVFGAVCRFRPTLTTEEALALLSKGRAVQVCLVNPGHFVALVAFDPDSQEFVINDPWGGRWPNKSGWNQRMTIHEFLHNTQPKFLVFGEAA
jgi:hypothetical protein